MQKTHYGSYICCVYKGERHQANGLKSETLLNRPNSDIFWSLQELPPLKIYRPSVVHTCPFSHMQSRTISTNHLVKMYEVSTFGIVKLCKNKDVKASSGSPNQ